MIRKYQVENQITGIADEADSFEEIKQIREQNIANFLVHTGAFVITILVQNEDGAWVQSVPDANGDLVIPEPPVVE
jgi:hypothetical protein